MQLYADLFKENHITGKRLLLLTENDMRDMGVKSKGHVMHLKVRCRKPLTTTVNVSFFLLRHDLKLEICSNYLFGNIVGLPFCLLQAEIEKLTNDYLGFVHFPPLLKV